MSWSIYVSDAGEPARLLMKAMFQEQAAELVDRIKAVGFRTGHTTLRASAVSDTEPEQAHRQPV